MTLRALPSLVLLTSRYARPSFCFLLFYGVFFFFFFFFGRPGYTKAHRSSISYRTSTSTMHGRRWLRRVSRLSRPRSATLLWLRSWRGSMVIMLKRFWCLMLPWCIWLVTRDYCILSIYISIYPCFKYRISGDRQRKWFWEGVWKRLGIFQMNKVRQPSV